MYTHSHSKFHGSQFDRFKHICEFRVGMYMVSGARLVYLYSYYDLLYTMKFVDSTSYIILRNSYYCKHVSIQ